MAKKFNTSNLDSMTDPLMDQVMGAIVGTPAKAEKKPKETPRKKPAKPANTAKPAPVKVEKEVVSEKIDDHKLYNYRKEERMVDGVGIVEKVVSEKGKLIGRPNTPTKEKKKPITLTLRPDLYDMVKDRAAADRRTTSEYLAMIIEEYLNS